MKRIDLLIVLILILIMSSCQTRQQRNIHDLVSQGVPVEEVMFSDNFTKVNDTIYRHTVDKTIFKKRRIRSGSYRYFLVR